MRSRPRTVSWHRAEAEPADGPSCRTIADMASAHGVHVVYGFEETGDPGTGAIHNSANIVAPDGLVGTYRKLHLGIPLETDRFTPGDALPVFHTDLGPIGIQICYDFYKGPELSRVLAMKGARLLVNPTGRSALPRAREHLEQVTNVRAHENLIAAASANRVGTSHGPPEWAGGSVIAAVEFPGFPVALAQAGVGGGGDHRHDRLRRDRPSGTTCSRGANGAPDPSSPITDSSPTSSPPSAASGARRSELAGPRPEATPDAGIVDHDAIGVDGDVGREAAVHRFVADPCGPSPTRDVGTAARPRARRGPAPRPTPS